MMRHDADKKIRFVMRQEKTLKVIANFLITDAPTCVLTNMNNNEKAYMWSCGDCSEKAEGELTKLAARFQNVDAAKDFKKQFEAAQTFNIDAKAGKADLIFADTVEDVEEKVEDDIDTNKTADADGEE